MTQMIELLCFRKYKNKLQYLEAGEGSSALASFHTDPPYIQVKLQFRNVGILRGSKTLTASMTY